MHPRIKVILCLLLASATCIYFFVSEPDEQVAPVSADHSVTQPATIGMPEPAPADRVASLKQVEVVTPADFSSNRRTIPVGVCEVIHDTEGNAEGTCNLGAPVKTELISPFRQH